MRKIALALTAAAALSFAPAAQAAPTISITGDSGVFSDNIMCAAACSFTSTISFLTPLGYNLTTASIGSNYTDPNLRANIDFTSVTLNGVAFNILTIGQQEFRDLFNQVMIPGMVNTILVSGTAGTNGGKHKGANATFAGTLSFAAAVPEPGTWAMMLLGFGAVGMGMRRRSRVLRPQVA